MTLYGCIGVDVRVNGLCSCGRSAPDHRPGCAINYDTSHVVKVMRIIDAGGRTYVRVRPGLKNLHTGIERTVFAPDELERV